MSILKMHIDLSGLESYINALQSLKADMPDVMLECTNALAAATLREVKKNTTQSKRITELHTVTRKGKQEQVERVVHRGGTLRRGWRADAAKKEGNVYRAEVYNTVEYAWYVEYGHRQTPGRYVSAIGKRLKASWVPGKHMLENAVRTVKPQAQKICRNRLLAVMKKLKGEK